jgi:MoaA/NifB/PqqE/SkfB family radical SAM enzyme
MVGDRVDLKLGFSCNNRCRFCVQGDKRHRVADLETGELLDRLKEAREHADSIVFTGGEVTLRKDLVELVAFAKSLGFRIIQIQTNGRMFSYRKTCEALVEAGANEFSPALHGHTAELHDYHTRAKGSFEQTVKGIRNLKALSQPVITNSVVTRSNYRHLPELAELLIRLGVDQYQFAFVHPVGTAGDSLSSVVPRLALAARYLAEGLDLGTRAGVRCMTEAVPPCILPGREHLVAEWIMPETRVYDAQVIVESYRDYRLTEGKLKGPRCPECHWFERCEGPWREYPERFGWEELVPVRDPARPQTEHLPGYSLPRARPSGKHRQRRGR